MPAASVQIIPLSCEHGGTAQDGVCMCAAGYMGDTCETGRYRFGAGNATSSSSWLFGYFIIWMSVNISEFPMCIHYGINFIKPQTNLAEILQK